jgi:hypothetical protein
MDRSITDRSITDRSIIHRSIKTSSAADDCAAVVNESWEKKALLKTFEKDSNALSRFWQFITSNLI